jgi:hypothetical protein
MQQCVKNVIGTVKAYASKKTPPPFLPPFDAAVCSWLQTTMTQAAVTRVHSPSWEQAAQ